VIVVVGLPAYADSPEGEKCAGGLSVDVAASARRRGADVELVGKIGNDGAGDAVVVALGRLGIGHAALLRDPARPTPVLAADAPGEESAADAEVGDGPTARLLPEDADARPALEAADLDLALSFLPGAGVIVVADPMPDAAVAAAIQGAAFAGARLVVLVAAGSVAPVVPSEATVLEAPADDDGSFGRMVGVFAAALDAGIETAAAFKKAVSGAGWEPIAG
jgi:sugar/nucleoside kinase (ribokinase family)